MAEATEAKMVPTLGLTGVTVNAMALIAPGAFLWITFVVQAGYAYPSGMAMWAGIFGAILLAYATALSYSELAKLYPGAGSSYLFAEKAFLNTTHAYRFARVAKYITGWASHLYYWVYPGVMAATIGVMIGYIVGYAGPERDERRRTGSGLYGCDGDNLRLRDCLHRLSWRGRIDDGQPGDQRDPDYRPAVFFRACDLLPAEPSGWLHRYGP